MIDKKPQPAYMLYVNGCEVQGQERFGHEAGMILEEKIPDFLAELGKTVAESGLDFEKWLVQNPDGVDLVAEKYQ